MKLRSAPSIPLLARVRIPLLARVPRYGWVAVLAGVAALVAVPIEYADTHSVLEAAQALLAVVIAAAIGCLVVSLPNVTPAGLAVGGFFVAGGALSWTYGKGVWWLLLLGGLGFMVWAWPWGRNLRQAVRLGGSWLGVSYWILGVVGAVLAGSAGIAGKRLLYAGAFGLAVVAAVASTRGRDTDRGDLATDRPGGRDLSVGVAAAFLIAIAALLVAGSGNLFDPHHVVVEGAWGRSQNLRFWGGEWLLYHPNSLAGIAVAAAIRIGLDLRFAAWQRLAGTALAGYVVFITNSRTGFLFLGTAALLHAVLLWWPGDRARRLRDRLGWLGRREVTGLPRYPGRRILAAAAIPFVVLALVLVASGGKGFIMKQRYGGEGGIGSGRVETWKAVGSEWRDAGIADKLFGDTKTVRAVVHRPTSPGVDLTTDNAAVGALRRGGVLGAAAFLLGLGLLLRRSVRRQVPAWFLVAVVAVLPTIAVADWVLGGTGGTVWILLVTGEAWVLLGAGASRTPDGDTVRRGR